MIKFKQLPENVLERIPLLSDKLREENNISVMYLFGSALNGFINPLSDLDIAVMGKKPLDFNDHIEL